MRKPSCFSNRPETTIFGQVRRENTHAADHRSIDQDLDHDRLLCFAFACRVAEQSDNAARHRQQRSRARVGRGHRQRQYEIDREHGPDHAIGGAHLQLVQQHQRDAAVESGSLHDGRKENAARQRNMTGAANPLAALGNGVAACDRTNSIGTRIPLTATGIASTTHTTATQATTASVAFPCARALRASVSTIRYRRSTTTQAQNPPRLERRARCLGNLRSAWERGAKTPPAILFQRRGARCFVCH